MQEAWKAGRLFSFKTRWTVATACWNFAGSACLERGQLAPDRQAKSVRCGQFVILERHGGGGQPVRRNEASLKPVLELG